MIAASQQGQSHADPTCRIEPGRTVRSSDPFRLVELDEVTGDGELQDFPDVADVILWNEVKELDPLEHFVIKCVCRGIVGAKLT